MRCVNVIRSCNDMHQYWVGRTYCTMMIRKKGMGKVFLDEFHYNCKIKMHRLQALRK